MVNDISGLSYDPRMPDVIAAYQVPVIIMHMKGTPKDMQKAPAYEALIPEILDYFREGIRIAMEAGIPEDMIVVDPGIGFGKRFEHNLEIIHNLCEFALLEKPLLIGPSRKAFIGKILGDVPPGERFEGTAAAVAISIFNGAHIIRVHDVKEMAKVAQVADAIKRMKIIKDDQE
jgi:dihydropteroate synthase